MSNLVPVQQINILGESSSSLQAAIRGELAAEEEFDLGIDLGEHNDLAGIVPDVPMIKVDGGAGVFLEKDQDPRTAAPEMFGVILARQGSKVFFPPRDRVLDYAKGVGFKELLAEELKWICRSANTARPMQAELNPALTQAQIEEAKQLKIGGATGSGCIGCPANSWYDPGDGQAKLRLCKDGENLVWLDSKKEEPVVLTVIAASSVVSLQKYLKTCFSNGKPLPLFRHLVKLSFDKEKSDRPGVKDYFVLSVTNLQPFDKPTLHALAGAYKGNLYLLDRASKRVDTDGHGFEAVEVSPEESGQEVQSADVLGGLL